MKATPSQLAAYVGKSERTIQRWLASNKWPHKRLPGGLVEIDDTLLIPPEEQQENAIPAILATLTRLEEKIDDLAAEVGALSAQPAPRYQIHTERAEYRVKPVSSEMPEGLIGWREYCASRGIAPTTVQKAISRGDVPVVRGKWKVGKVYVEGALDEEGRAAVDRLYGSRSISTD